MSTRYARLARAERSAEQTRARADQEWREAWWNLSIALSQSSGPATSAIYSEIAPILDQTKRYLGLRRSLALRLDARVIDSGTAHKLPPRLALEWAQVVGAGAAEIDMEIAQSLIKYEKDGVSLRELRGLLGAENPPSWHNADERAAAMEGIRQQAYSGDQLRAALRNPDVRREVVRHVGEDRDLARDVATNRKASGSIENARREAVRDRLAKANLHTGRKDPDIDTPYDVATAVHEMVKARIAIKEACKHLTDTPMTEPVKDAVSGHIAGLDDAMNALHSIVSGNGMDEALRSLLESAE